MPQGNLEIVRRALDLMRDCYASGTATDGLLELCAPDIRVDATRRVFNPGVYEGEAGVQRSIREICDAWEDFHQINERLIDLGDRVVVLQTIAGRGRASKVHVEQKGALICTLRDGLVRHIEVFTNQAEALRAVGEEA
jgi:ketosteroid isomerase-like protein